MIRRLFTDIAAIYDRMNHVLSLGLDRRWRRMAAADVKGTPTRILDLACGTGDFTFALARRFPEATLFFLAVLGGSIGGIAGMAAFRHKTLHKSFRLGFPAVLIAQLALAGYLVLKWKGLI